MVDKKRFAEEESLGYRIEIFGKNIQVMEPMKQHIWDKISKLERFHNHIMHVHVTLDIQRLDHICTMLVKLDHFEIKVKAESTDMYASIDKAVDKLQSLMRKYKGRMQDHVKKGLSAVDIQVNVLKAPYDEVAEINAALEVLEKKDSIERYLPTKVVGTETRLLKTLTLEEAVMKIDLSGEMFLVFRGEEDRKLKVLYRRSDGNLGLIQPE